MPTLIIKRLIKSGYEREYEQSLVKMIEEAEQMDGYLGSNIARPAKRNNPLYIYSIKFDTQKHLQAYKDSPLRQQLLKEWHEQSQKPVIERTIKSIDWWFILPNDNSEIARYKIILVSILAAYPVVFIVSMFTNKVNDIGTLALKDFFLIFLTVLIMNYVTLPLFFSLFEKWMQKQK